MNNIVIPWHYVVLNHHTFVTFIPTRIKFYTVTDLCIAFFSIPVDEASQCIFAFTWEEKKFTWTVMPQDFTESLPFFLFCLWKGRECPRVLIANHGSTIDPQRTITSNLDPVARGYTPCLRKNHCRIPFNHVCTSCSRSSPEFLPHSTFLSQLPYFLWSHFINCFSCKSFML